MVKTYSSLKEVAAFLGLSQNYIYELVHQRKIPFYKPFGKKLMFNLDEVKATIEGSKVESKASYSEIDVAANNLMLRRGRANG
jgi:excisionase family DNA binding protein